VKKDTLLLILLSAIWGGSFIFMRLLAPVLGAASTASFRLLIGGISLLAYYQFIKFKIDWKNHGLLLLGIGITNSALPFFLYAFAALYIPASLSVMINAMAPVFGAIFGVIILKESLHTQKILGLFIGTLGVVTMSYSKALPNNTMAYISILACLGAAACYGFSGAIIKKYAKDIPTKSLAGASQIFAGTALLPWVLTTPIEGTINIKIIALVLAFGILCSGLAYLIYFHIMKSLGPTRALTVTFLMPVFGVIWGKILLNEQLYLQSLLGGLLILFGTYWVVKPQKRRYMEEILNKEA
jgi:drug/metabolite transporter (DMT)-like permease